MYVSHENTDTGGVDEHLNRSVNTTKTCKFFLQAQGNWCEVHLPAYHSIKEVTTHRSEAVATS